jgi:hypothetical protein
MIKNTWTPIRVDHRSESRPPQKKAAVALPSEDWPGTPPLIFTSRGVLNLNDQDPKIQTILRNTFHKVNGDILYRNAFPDVGERLKYSRSALYSICKQLKYAAIAQRLGNDEAYSKEIAKVVRHSSHATMSITDVFRRMRVGPRLVAVLNRRLFPRVSILSTSK